MASNYQMLMLPFYIPYMHAYTYKYVHFNVEWQLIHSDKNACLTSFTKCYICIPYLRRLMKLSSSCIVHVQCIDDITIKVFLFKQKFSSYLATLVQPARNIVHPLYSLPTSWSSPHYFSVYDNIFQKSVSSNVAIIDHFFLFSLCNVQELSYTY